MVRELDFYNGVFGIGACSIRLLRTANVNWDQSSILSPNNRTRGNPTVTIIPTLGLVRAAIPGPGLRS